MVNAIIAGLLCAGVNIFIAVKDAPVWVRLCYFFLGYGSFTSVSPNR